MDLARLEELKHKLTHGTQLSVIWTFFLDHLASSPQFMALGERAEHPLVETVIDQVARQLFPRDPQVSNLLLTRLDDQQFLHGGFTIGRCLGGVLYFEDLHKGLITVCEAPPSIEVKYARFSGLPLPQQRRGAPSAN
jgi:hypothetical protein